MVNEKKGLTIDEQIIYLKENKNIVFKNEEEREAKEYLLKYSYTDVINPLKVLFSSGYDPENKCHIYAFETSWSEIQKLHKQSRKIEKEVVHEILNFEQSIKSFFCHWLSGLIMDKKFESFSDFIDKLKIKTIDRIRLRHKYEIVFFNNYNNAGYPDEKYENRWWLLINSLSFGEFKNLLYSKIEINNEVKKVIVFISEELLMKEHQENENTKSMTETLNLSNLNLDTINILRNSLCHKTNILIYLDQPLKKNDRHTHDERRITLQHFMKKAGINEPVNNSEKVITFYKEKRNKRQESTPYRLNLIQNDM